MDCFQPNADLLSTVQQLLARKGVERLPKYNTRRSDLQGSQSGAAAQDDKEHEREPDFLSTYQPGMRHWFISRLERLAHHFWVEYSVDKQVRSSPKLPRSSDEKAASSWEVQQAIITEHYYSPMNKLRNVKLGPQIFKSPWRATGVTDFSANADSAHLGRDEIAAVSNDISAAVLSRRPDAHNITCTYQGCYARCNISFFSVVASHSQELVSQMHSDMAAACEGLGPLGARLPSVPQQTSAEAAVTSLPPLAPIDAAVGSAARPRATSADLEARTMCNILSTALRHMPSSSAMHKYADASQKAVQVSTIRAALLPDNSLRTQLGHAELMAARLPSGTQILVPGATASQPTAGNPSTLSEIDMTILEFLNLSPSSTFASNQLDPDDPALWVEAAQAIRSKLAAE